MLSLLVTVEPTEKQPCSLGLLIVGSAAQIEHYLGILIEELLDDADDRLRYLLVARRLLLPGVGEVEPVGGIVWVGVKFEVHVVFNTRVGHEPVSAAACLLRWRASHSSFTLR